MHWGRGFGRGGVGRVGEREGGRGGGAGEGGERQGPKTPKQNRVIPQRYEMPMKGYETPRNACDTL